MRDDSEAKLGYSLGELMDEFAEDDARWQSLSRYGDVEYIYQKMTKSACGLTVEGYIGFPLIKFRPVSNSLIGCCI